VYENLKSQNSQDYAQKPQQNCAFMNSASGHCTVHCVSAANRSSEQSKKLSAQKGT
jgi:hypothetical protein